MTKILNPKTYLKLACLVWLLLPSSAFARRYSGLAKTLEEATGDTGMLIIRWLFLIIGILLIAIAVINPAFADEAIEPQEPGFLGFMLRTFGPKGVRVTLALSGLLLVYLFLDTRNQVPLEPAIEDIRCGSPGTNSYLDSEGYCDCKDGYTWLNESDPNNVHCTAIK